MGITVNLYLIKDKIESEKLDYETLLNELGAESYFDKKEISYEEVCANFRERNPEPLIGIAYYKDHFLIKDDFCLLPWDRFKSFTLKYQTSILQAENSDTVGICSFSYFENGQQVRRRSFGNDEWIEEMREAGIDESHMPQDWDEGELLDIEKNGSSAFEVMETYGIDYFKFYDLEWEIRRIEIRTN